jgi:FHA domain
MAAMDTEHAEAIAALDQIDTTSVEALAGIKREHEGVKQLIDKAAERKDKVAPPVYAKVMEDYEARLRGLEDKARPLREQARAELSQLVVLYAKLKSAWEASQLAQQEIEFRFELGELPKEDFEGKQAQAKAEVGEREKSFARANELRLRFEEVLPALPPAPAPKAAPKPAPKPAPLASAPTPAVSVPAASATDEAPRSETIVMPRGVGLADMKPKTPTDSFRTMAVSMPRFVDEPGGRVFEIDAGTSIGRTPDNHIALDVREVSRRHARIDLQEDGSFVLVDMGSGNGTFVNDQRIKEHKLQHGDRVRIGNELFVYHKD